MAARDIIQAAAGAAGATEANYIEDCFSCHLYTGTGASQTITNGIDLSTKGGLVWIKARSSAEIHDIYDTVRGANKLLYPNGTVAEVTRTAALTGFSATGFTLGTDGNYEINTSGTTYASWTFRKQPKFFDVVTYTGNGDNGRQIAHNLGCVPGMVIIKKTSATGAWAVWHKGSSISSSIFGLSLNATSAAYLTTDATGQFTSTVFTPYYVQDAGATSPSNQSGQTYVAYLFADSNSGGFGSAGTDSVVACGSFTTDGSGNATVNLGWEPQFVMFKASSAANNWWMVDIMRGLPASGNENYLAANLSNAENPYGSAIHPTATGFTVSDAASTTYIYLAIRRGPMKTPTDATKVFKPVTQTTTGAAGQNVTCGFPPDFTIMKMRSASYGFGAIDKLRGTSALLQPSLSASELTNETGLSSFGQSGLVLSGSDYNLPIGQSAADMVFNLFRRATGFFDVVCYTGTGVYPFTVNHNLGVAPELIITRSRSNNDSWYALNSFTETNYRRSYLNSNGGGTVYSYGATAALNAQPSASTYVIDGNINTSTYTYVAYLFATCPGVSKVGTFNINASDVNVDCGFTNGARFILVKRTDATGSWLVCDTARGIVNGNDPYLQLNTAAGEGTTLDLYAPYSAGFTAKAATFGGAPASYIYLAIA